MLTISNGDIIFIFTYLFDYKHIMATSQMT